MRHGTGFLATAFFSLCLAAGAPAQDEARPGPRIDVREYEVDVELIPENSYLKGVAKVTFEVLEDAISVPFELNSRISLIRVEDEEGEVYSPSFDNFNSSRMLVRAPEAFQAGSTRTLTFTFDGTLDSEQYAYLDDTPRSDKAFVDPDGALLLTEGRWFPSHDLPLDVASGRLRVEVPLGFTAVGPGRLEGIETVGVSEVFTWINDRAGGDFPVSVARYARQSFDDLPVPLTFYVTQDFSQDLAPLVEQATKILEAMKQSYGDDPLPARLNFAEVGNVELPTPGARGLTLMEAPLLESPTPPIQQLALRLADQWWRYGLHVANASDVWLQDSFSQYAALRYFEQAETERAPALLGGLAIDALKYEQRSSIAGAIVLGRGTPQYDSVVRAKGAWVLYMLRQIIGDGKLNGWIEQWYRDHAGQTVDGGQFVDYVNARAGQDYRWFFAQWVEGTGVPEFKVDYTILKKTAGGFRIRGQIQQDQELFQMPVEIEVQTKGKPEVKALNLRGKSTRFDFETETLPIRLEIDPKGNILRDSEKMRVAVYIALGEEYQRQGEFVSAIREFEKAKTLFPLSSLANYRLGETFFQQHSYNSAANSFRDALNGNLQPEWVETWTHIHLGKIYDVLGQRQRALAEYQKAVNTQIDYNGAQAEAKKYIEEPFSKPRSVIG